MIHVKNEANQAFKLALVTFYSPRKNRQTYDGHLQFITNSLKQFHPGINIIVTGDFNRRRPAIDKLAQATNLQALPIPNHLLKYTRLYKMAE